MNLQKRIKKVYSSWIKKKMLKDYYLNQSSRPPGAKILHYFLVFCCLSLLAIWRAASYKAAMINMLLVFILMIAIVFIANRRRSKQLEDECRGKLSSREYNARLEQCSQHDILKMLMEKIEVSYPVLNMRITENNVLEGENKGKKIAVYYLYPGENGFMETKDIVGILRECGQNSINVVRIFTHGQYSNKAFSLAERYGIDLKLYDGDRLRAFLKDSILVPAQEEIDTIIKQEIQKRKKRREIIRKQMLQRKKTGNYLLYSAILFSMAWFKIGAFYWNIVFALLLFGLAVSSFVLKKSSAEEEALF